MEHAQRALRYRTRAQVFSWKFMTKNRQYKNDQLARIKKEVATQLASTQ